MVRSQGLTIAGLAAAAGVGVETVRYYQRRGLLQTPARAGGIRRYGPNDVRRLRFIREAQAAGFTLAEIADLVELDASENRERARDLAEERIRELDARIATLQAARDALSRLAEECRSGKRGPCPILSSFGL